MPLKRGVISGLRIAAAVGTIVASFIEGVDHGKAVEDAAWAVAESVHKACSSGSQEEHAR